MKTRRFLAFAGCWAALCVLGGPAAPAASAQDVIFVVRHAEKAASPPNDPPLSAEGRRRAEALRDMLKEARITGIITSPAARTRQTAGPLAAALNLTPSVDPMDDAGALAERIRSLPGGGNVLVVGHSNTVPQLLRALGHPSSIEIEESEFDNLFVVTPSEVTRPSVTRLRYKP